MKFTISILIIVTVIITFIVLPGGVGCSKLGFGDESQFSDFAWGMTKKEVEKLAREKYYTGGEFNFHRGFENISTYETVVLGEDCEIIFEFGTKPPTSFKGLSGVVISWKDKPPSSEQLASLEKKHGCMISIVFGGSVYFQSKKAKKGLKAMYEERSEETGRDPLLLEINDHSKRIDELIKNKPK